MSNLYKGKLPFEMSPQDEMEYRRRRYQLEMKYKKMAEDELRKNAEESKVASRSVTTRKDPMKVLNAGKNKAMIHVLNFLTGKELMQAMEVSLEWKMFIEGQSFLMDRAMDEIRFKPILDDEPIELQVKIFGDGPHKRHYKHMSSIFMMLPLISFASSLETLELTHPDQWWEISDSWKGLDFPKLKMIRFVGDREDFLVLKKLSLPTLTHLQLVCVIANNNDRDKEFCCDAATLSEFLSGFEALKCIHAMCTNCAIYKCYGLDLSLGYLCDKRDGDVGVSMEGAVQNKLEQMSIDAYYPNVMKHHVQYLKFLEVDQVDSSQLRWILQYMKALKVLRVRFHVERRHVMENIPTNTSLEIFSKYFMSHDLPVVRALLVSMPNLIILPLTDEIKEIYEELGGNSQVNSTLAIMDLKLDEYQLKIDKYQSSIEEAFKKNFKYE